MEKQTKNNTSNRYKVFDYEVSTDTDWATDGFDISPDVKDILQQTYFKVLEKDRHVVNELHSLIEKTTDSSI